MPRELTLHPETGQLVEVVHSYQSVELGALQADVQAKEQARAEAQARVEVKQAELQTAATELSQADGALEESKSSLARGTELVGQPEAGVDPGTDGTGSEAETPVEGANF